MEELAEAGPATAPSPDVSLQPYFTLPFALHLRPLPHVSFLAERSSSGRRADADGEGLLSSEDNLSGSSSSTTSSSGSLGSSASAGGSPNAAANGRRKASSSGVGAGGQRAGTHKLRPHVQAPPPHSLEIMSILMERTCLLEAIEPLAQAIKMLDEADDDKEFTRLRRFFDARFDEEGHLIQEGEGSRRGKSKDNASSSSPTKKGRKKGFGALGRAKSKADTLPQQQQRKDSSSLWKRRPSGLRQASVTSGGGEGGSSWIRALSPEGQQHRKLSQGSGANLSLGALGVAGGEPPRRPSFRQDGFERDIREEENGEHENDVAIDDEESVSVQSPSPSSPSRHKLSASPPQRMRTNRTAISTSRTRRPKMPLKAPEVVAKRGRPKSVRFNVRLDLHSVGLAPPPPPLPRRRRGGGGARRARTRSTTTGSVASRGSNIMKRHQDSLVSTDRFASSPEQQRTIDEYAGGAPLGKVMSPESVRSARSLGQLSEENSGSQESEEISKKGRRIAGVGPASSKPAASRGNLPFGSPSRNPSRLGSDSMGKARTGDETVLAPLRNAPEDPSTILARAREAHDSDREGGEISEAPSSSASHSGPRRASRKGSGLAGLFGGNAKDPTGNRRPSMIQRLMSVGKLKNETASNKSNTSLALGSNTSSEALHNGLGQQQSFSAAAAASADQQQSQSQDAYTAKEQQKKQMPSLANLQVPPPSFAPDEVSPTSHAPPVPLHTGATPMLHRPRSKTSPSEWGQEEDALDLGDDELEGSMGGSSAGWSRSMRSSFGAQSSLPFRGRASSSGTAATGAPTAGWMAWSVPKGDQTTSGGVSGGGATGLMLEPELRPVQEGRVFDSDSVFSGRSGQPEGSYRVFSDGDDEHDEDEEGEEEDEEDEEGEEELMDDEFDDYSVDEERELGASDLHAPSWNGQRDFLSLLRSASEKALSLVAGRASRETGPSEKALGKKPEGEVTPQQGMTRPNSIELEREEMADALLEAIMGQSTGPKGIDAEDGWWPCGSADPLPITFAAALAEALGWQGVMRLCYGKGSLCARAGDFAPLGRAADLNDKQKEDSDKVERWARDVSESTYASPKQSGVALPSGLMGGRENGAEEASAGHMPELAPQTTIESSLAPSESASTKANPNLPPTSAAAATAEKSEATPATAAQALLGKWKKLASNNRPARQTTMTEGDERAGVGASADGVTSLPENTSSAGANASSTGDEAAARKRSKSDRTWDDWSRLSVSMASWVQEYEKCRVRNGLAREFAIDSPSLDEQEQQEQQRQDSGFVESTTPMAPRKDSGNSLEVPFRAADEFGTGFRSSGYVTRAQAQVPLCVRSDATRSNHGYRRRHGIPEGLPLGPDGEELGEYRWARSKLKPRHFATSLILSSTSLSYFFGQLASSPWVHTSSWELDYLEMCVFKSPLLAQRFPPPGSTIAIGDQSFQPSPSAPEAARAKPCPNPTPEGWWDVAEWVEWLGQVKEGMMISPAVSFQAWWTLIAALNGADGSGRNFNLQVKAYEEPFEQLLSDHGSVYL